MKTTTCKVIGALLVTGALTTINITFAQTVETIETAVSSEGTISEFGAQLLVLKTDTAPEPVRYTFSETTTYVDEEGKPVAVTSVKSGLPVTVYYTRVGESLVASKVMVRKPVPMSAGTISEFSPEQIIIKTATSPEPMRYTFSKTTTYLDEAGRPVSIKTVKSGLPVTVYYTKVGDSMIATRVVVRKPAPAFITSVGTIGEFGADLITVKTEASPDAIRYTYSKTTTYVDEAGNPVALTTVKSGLPVTLQYTKIGDTLMVSKVIVRKAVIAPPPVIETKKTTTTTTTTKDK